MVVKGNEPKKCFVVVHLFVLTEMEWTARVGKVSETYSDRFSCLQLLAIWQED